jgi:tRNA-splicing ligase RtcB (3'-phosphate/5'-hydroxy nucleic acid ligase)
MNKEKNIRRAHLRSSKDGQFVSQSVGQEGNYRVCNIEGTEIRVWGASEGKSLPVEVVSTLRSAVRRVKPELPIALMADHHPAEFGVVGSVIPSGSLVVPDIIGNDCGCGVYAARLDCNIESDRLAVLPKLYRSILERIPVGSAQHREVSGHIEDLDLWNQLAGISFVSKNHLRKLRHQFGSLGGGNHFIELATDEEQHFWLLVHSGSRYLGGILKEYYQSKDLHIGENDAEEFFQAQQIVMRFAHLSRKEIVSAVLRCMMEVFQCEFNCAEEIDLTHNFVALEEHNGAVVAIHRKGACIASKGQAGIIPGSMGTGSYIVEGRGSLSSYSSSSHGAGRAKSRGEAFRTIPYRKVLADMEGIVWAQSKKLTDEAPDAYKDINVVMSAQRDLVRVRHRLKPLLAVKGGA